MSEQMNSLMPNISYYEDLAVGKSRVIMLSNLTITCSPICDYMFLLRERFPLS